MNSRGQTITIPAAPVPALRPEQLAARRAHLVREITTPTRTHRRTSVIAATGLAASAAAALIVVLASTSGPVPDAFAGWTPTPSGVPAAQVTQVRAACLAALAATTHAGSSSAAPAWVTALSEQRGQASLMILQRAAPGAASGDRTAGGTAPAARVSPTRIACLRLGAAGTSITNLSSAADAPTAPNQAVIGRIAHAQHDGNGFSLVTGTVGSAVTSVTLHLADGRSVAASVSTVARSEPQTPRLFSAWWPSTSNLTRITVATAAGVTNQDAPRPGPTGPAWLTRSGA